MTRTQAHWAGSYVPPKFPGLRSGLARIKDKHDFHTVKPETWIFRLISRAVSIRNHLDKGAFFNHYKCPLSRSVHTSMLLNPKRFQSQPSILKPSFRVPRHANVGFTKAYISTITFLVFTLPNTRNSPAK